MEHILILRIHSRLSSLVMICLRIFQLYGAVLSDKISFTNFFDLTENHSIYERCSLAKNMFDLGLSVMPTQSQTFGC